MTGHFQAWPVLAAAAILVGPILIYDTREAYRDLRRKWQQLGQYADPEPIDSERLATLLGHGLEDIIAATRTRHRDPDLDAWEQEMSQR